MLILPHIYLLVTRVYSVVAILDLLGFVCYEHTPRQRKRQPF
jgi:hypothetical protein